MAVAKPSPSAITSGLECAAPARGDAPGSSSACNMGRPTDAANSAAMLGLVPDGDAQKECVSSRARLFVHAALCMLHGAYHCTDRRGGPDVRVTKDLTYTGWRVALAANH